MSEPRKSVTPVLPLIVATAFIGGPTSLQACSCIRTAPVCQAAWTSDAVFLGKVTSVSGWLERMLFGSFQQKHVMFEVAENFNGLSDKTIEIVTGTGGGDCGFPFQEGHEYLVYASHSTETRSLYAGICSRTAPAERAAADLVYLRSLAKGGPPSRIFGFVTGYSPGVGIELRYAERAPHPIANVPIHLESEVASRRTFTDSLGNYTFDGLPAGMFSVSADMPRNLGGGEKRTVSLRNHACSESNFIAVERAQLTGSLLDDKGAPVVTTQVVMVRTGSSKNSDNIMAYTDERGIFTVQRLPPGDFVLGVNISEPPREGQHLSHPFPPTYFPGVPDRANARIIHVESAQQLAGFELRLPARLKQRTILGRVTWPDGKPALGAYVELKDSEFADRNVDLGTAGPDGAFVVTGVQGRLYSLSSVIGIGEGQNPVHTETVQLGPEQNGPIHLVLSLPGRR
jgi:hypothetical protein